MVIGEEPEEQLEPYNENTVVERYVRYTKQQLIENKKKEIEKYKNEDYAEFIADKEKYKEEHKGNKGHLNYIENEFPLQLHWTDEEIYAHEIGFYDAEEIGENGDVYSEYNPKSKWDWYELGGRWRGLLTLKNGDKADQAEKQHIANLSDVKTFAVVKEGKWYECGEMGWWGIVIGGKDEETWAKEFENLLNELPDETLITIFDCHI